MVSTCKQSIARYFETQIYQGLKYVKTNDISVCVTFSMLSILSLANPKITLYQPHLPAKVLLPCSSSSPPENSCLNLPINFSLNEKKNLSLIVLRPLENL